MDDCLDDFPLCAIRWVWESHKNGGSAFLQLLQEQMVEPAVNGTKNVIIAAAEANVRRVVFTSSIGAVYMDPNRGPDDIVDESCWSDLEFCKNTKVQSPSISL